ncbi:hypothetical protein KJ764_04565 [Patescibacteria group bacterium]|nr:hypothetical protein [Patescibacteria group bacterium]
MFFYEKRLVFQDGTTKSNSPEELEGSLEQTPKEEAIEESQVDRVDLRLERMETEEEVIKGIDINLSPESQQDAIDTLESVCHIMLTRLFQKREFSLEKVQEDILLLEKTPNKTKTEKAASKKIQEILEAEGKPMFLWLSNWSEIAETSHQIYEDALERKGEIEKTKGRKGTLGNRIITAGLVIGGAYVGYKLVKWLWGKSKQGTQEKAKKGIGIFGKILAGVGAALGIVTIGALLSPDHVGKWVSDNLGLNLSKDSLRKFASLMFKGDFKGAFKQLSAEVEVHYPFIGEAAEKIGVDPKNLLLIKDRKYEDFMSFGAQAERQTESFIQGFMPELEIPLVFSAEQEAKAIKDEKILFKFLKQYEEDIELIEPKETIEDVLKGLNKIGKLGWTPGEDPGEGGGDDTPEIIGNNFPHVIAAVRKWEENGKKWGDIDEMAFEVIEGVLADGGHLIVHEGAVFLVQGETWLLLTSFNVIAQTFWEAIKAMGEDTTYKDVIEEYLDSGGKYFILGSGGFGALTGAVRGAAQTGTLMGAGIEAVKGGSRGAVRGLAGPAEVIRLHITASQRMYRFGVDKHYAIGTLMRPTEVEKLEYLHSRAKFHAEVYRKYYDIKYLKNKGFKTPSKLYRLMYSERLDALIERHGQKFLETYSAYQRKLGVKETSIAWEKGRIGAREDTYIETEKFIKGGEFAELRLVPAAEVEARAKEMAKKAGKPDEWESFKDKAQKELEAKATQPKPKKVNLAHKAQVEAARNLPESQLTKETLTIRKLQKLGVTDDAILRMKEMGLAVEEMELAVKKITEDPSKLRRLDKVMTEAKYAKYRPYLQNAKMYGGIVVAAVVIHGYEEADDKMDYLARTGAEFGAFFAGAGAAHRVTGPTLMGKGGIWGTGAALIIDLAAGLGAAIGVDMVWDETGGYMLDRYFQDRQLNWTDDPNSIIGDINTKLMLGGGAAMGAGEWLTEKVGIGGRVGANTDPIEYLQDEAVMFKPIQDIFTEWHKGFFEGVSVHDKEQLERRAGRTLDKKQEKLEELQQKLAENPEKAEKIQEKIEKIESQIDYLEKIADGSWVQERMMLLVINQELFLNPAYDDFRRLAEAKFEGGGKAFDAIMAAVSDDSRKITDELTKEVWKFLLNKSVDTADKDLRFREFILQVKMVETQMNFLQKYLPSEKLDA